MMLYDHPPIVHQAIAALQPTCLIKEIKPFDDRVELHLENGQVLTQYTLHPPAEPAEAPVAECRPEQVPEPAEGLVEAPPAEPVEGAGTDDLSSLPMHALRSLASDLALTFTNKTTKKDLLALISAARSSVPPPPSVKDGGGREGAVE